ncbi:MAG: MBL fold metallo-hydrolase [Bacteroidales bacterium]|nr:MBL fold metallo-hydrolase [Bacteroidales bacterium]
MISITFKNVGQGDSIFLEWKNNDDNHFGIIDSNKYKDTNPILEELKKRKITEIDFIIISHLHYDHYSGIAEILDYCIYNSIKINSFLHTLQQDYLFIFSKILKSTKQKFVLNSWLWFRYSVKYVYCNNPERDLTIVTIGATYGRNRIDKKNSDRSSTPFGVDVLYS